MSAPVGNALAMTPAQLRAFAAIARHGSARKAAAELGVSEAAISSHTAALRKELDDPLYRRSANGLSFTPGGLRLATRAVEMLGLADRTRQEVQAAAQGRRVLRVAASSLFAEASAPGLIELFTERADDLEVELSVHGSDSFEELLAGRRADVTIGPGRGTPPAPLRAKEFLKYQLLVVVGPGHPLALGKANPASLRSQSWLLGPSAVEPRGVTTRLLRRFKVPERSQMIFQSHAAALAETRVGAGIGVVLEAQARTDLTEGRLVRVPVPGGAMAGVWTATTLHPTQTSAVASELMRFITTPRATQAMLTGSGANIGHFRPSVHVTLWS